MTLNSAFLMTEMARPAAMSPTVALFLLRLLDARVHEHGAAASQINRVGGLDRGAGEVGDVEVQTRREALDEAAAARRARLVEHDMVDDAVFHAQALHVLAADVQDELDARQHLLGTAQMRDGLDLPESTRRASSSRCSP